MGRGGARCRVPVRGCSSGPCPSVCAGLEASPSRVWALCSLASGRPPSGRPHSSPSMHILAARHPASLQGAPPSRALYAGQAPKSPEPVPTRLSTPHATLKPLHHPPPGPVWPPPDPAPERLPPGRPAARAVLGRRKADHRPRGRGWGGVGGFPWLSGQKSNWRFWLQSRNGEQSSEWFPPLNKVLKGEGAGGLQGSRTSAPDSRGPARGTSELALTAGAVPQPTSPCSKGPPRPFLLAAHRQASFAPWRGGLPGRRASPLRGIPQPVPGVPGLAPVSPAGAEAPRKWPGCSCCSANTCRAGKERMALDRLSTRTCQGLRRRALGKWPSAFYTCLSRGPPRPEGRPSGA